MTRACVVVLGPSRRAISGVSTHVNLLLDSTLAREFRLAHFQVGSEGRVESRLGRALRLAISPFALAARVVALRADIVHINTSLDPRAYWRDLVYLAVAKLCGARVLYQVHGGSLPGDFFARPALRRLLKAALGWPDALVVLARCELEAYKRFVPAQNIVAVPHGVDCAPYAVRTRSPGERLRLLYLGRLAPGKGLDELLEGVRGAKRSGSKAQLVIAGSGPDEARLRHRVRELALDQEVTFAGAAFGERKLELLAAADVMLLPSYSEGLPYALLEAMAAGVVPVVTPVGAMPDVVVNGVHGVLVPRADAGAVAAAISSLDADRAGLARMSAACRQRVVGAYSVGRVMADFAALYSALRATRAPKAAH